MNGAFMEIFGLNEPSRVYRNYCNPMDALQDEHFTRMFRMDKRAMNNLKNIIFDDNVETNYSRGRFVPRIMITMIGVRYLASNSKQRDISELFQVDQKTISRCLSTFLYRLNNKISAFIVFPTDAEEVAKIKQGFQQFAGMMDIVGALDGTAVHVTVPTALHNDYHGRKGRTFNVQAVCNAEGQFLMVDTAQPGTAHDSYAYSQTELHAFLNTPPGLPGRNCLPGDSAYALSRTCLTPYLNPTLDHQRHFNRCHAKTRVIIEQVFGRLKNSGEY